MSTTINFEMTFEEIAEEMGISKQRAHQIYSKAMKKVRSNIERRGLNLDEFSSDSVDESIDASALV